jgi:hypothetical protein
LLSGELELHLTRDLVKEERKCASGDVKVSSSHGINVSVADLTARSTYAILAVAAAAAAADFGLRFPSLLIADYSYQKLVRCPPRHDG